MTKGKKNGFTLIEVLIVCSIFAIMLVGIIGAINRAYVFMDKTKMQVATTNLAREGVEMMFEIRDTNWRKCSGKKDDFWLYVGTGEDVATCSTREDYKFKSGYYIINEQSGHVYATGFLMDEATYKGNSFLYDIAKVNFSGDYKYLSGSELATGYINGLMTGYNFYRVVRVYDVVNKLENGHSNEDPKEMRFCVKVLSTSNGGKHTSEICSMMTNFQE